MADNDMKPSNDIRFAFGVSEKMASETITARKAGELSDLKLCVSPAKVGLPLALRNLTKALNLAIEDDFLETPLDSVYRAARVRGGEVQVLHRKYIGLGDGIFATIGKAAQSVSLTLKGPDAASPEGEKWIAEHGGSALAGMLNLVGRKLNLIREFEDKVPVFVEQTLDRLEARNMITDWNRDEWEITTTVIGLDVILRPRTADELEESAKE
jgi:hypothetical protein